MAEALEAAHEAGVIHSPALMSADHVASGEAGSGARPRVHVVLNWVEELNARVPVP